MMQQFIAGVDSGSQLAFSFSDTAGFFDLIWIKLSRTSLQFLNPLEILLCLRSDFLEPLHPIKMLIDDS